MRIESALAAANGISISETAPLPARPPGLPAPAQKSGYRQNPQGEVLRTQRAGDGAQLRRVLFVTPEMADFVKVGGLGEVSAALPRSLRENCDVRVLVPGYRAVLERRDEIELIGSLPRLAGIPPCGIGRIVTADGITVYVVLCDELYDREGTPYNDAQGGDFPDNDIRFARLSLAAVELAEGRGDPEWAPD